LRPRARFPAGLLLLAALAFAADAPADEEPVLNIYNWADYIAPDTIPDFEREFGIEVNYDVYDSTEVVEAKLLSGKTGYDVVFHSYRYSARLIPIGVYQPLDRSRLTGQANLDPWVLNVLQEYDPGNLYGVPHMWGTTGFAYNEDMVRERMPDAPVDSAGMLFDPAVVSRFADCGVSLLDEPSDVIPMVLLYLGLDPNSLEPADLAAAEAQLKSVRPYIRYFSSTKMMNDLPNRETCIAMSWSGDYAQAMQRAAEVGSEVRLAYTVPREGTVLWFDGVFIPADAEHPGNAHLFIDYLMRPKVIAAISNTTYYANANVASMAYIRPEILADAAVYPPESERSRFDIGFIFGPKQERRRTRAWARVKTGL
jgi:putrescine transport system substrate-binding protein